MNWITVATVLIAVNFGLCGNSIDPHFMKWMKKNLKPEEVKKVVRDELTTGSFGGGRIGHSTDRPVVFVHGLNNEAGSLWKIARDMAAAGFSVKNMFATSWGRGVESANLNVKMSCDHVLHIRRFIQIVLWYTGADQIDVIGYSMGAPLARKAILGGKCVDNQKVDMGPPLTAKIHTFISVAGANQGSQLCFLPFFDICNMDTGLNCVSKFLKDINSHQKFESTYKSFNLASTGDFVVGYTACGKKASEFSGAHEWKLKGMDHEQTEFDTAAIQLKMLRETTPGTSRRRSPAKKNSFSEVKRYLKSPRSAPAKRR
ncbi:unnamed protein product [Caenorhabditis sp. 36 PRJEB53466]|nr:unnamed protein product [Caenorhabditis sp. 36 PRJEB53466]